MERSNNIPLQMRGVSFRYARQNVLDGFDLTLQPGQVTALAAPNGAGKTTALWLAAGLYQADRGEVRLLGQDPFVNRGVFGQVGFLAEGAPLPPSWTGERVLAFQRGTFPAWDEAECKRLTERFALDLRRKVKELSRGERGRLALTAVLCTRPQVLLLDEPALGLDVASRRMLAAEILGRLVEGGASVLLASNEIAEAERAADRLVLLSQGKVALNEEVASLLERHRVLSWKDTPPPPASLDLLPMADRLGKRVLARAWDAQKARGFLAAGGEEAPADLETIYLSLTGGLDYA